jgi:hypothetical protein
VSFARRMGFKLREHLARRPALLLAFFYLLVALAFSLNFCSKTTILDVPDEGHHLLRAIQIGQGGLLGKHYAGNFVGGQIPLSAIQASDFVSFYLYHPGMRISPAVLASYKHLGWRSPPQPAEFANTAIYPPWFYVASATAIDIGRALDLPVMRSFQISRIANAVSSVLIGTLAIGLAETGSPVLAVLLALPMTLFLFGSASQDSLMIACAALAAALLTRQASGFTLSWFEWLASGVLLGAIGAARAPYIMLSLIPALFAWPRADRNRGLATTMVALVLALLWLFASVIPLSVPTKAGGGLLSGVQMHWILDHPIAASTVLLRSLVLDWSELLQEFIGVLGWLDIRLPRNIYRACECALVVTLVMSLPLPQQLRLRHIEIALLMLGVAAAIEVAIFLSWNTVGEAHIGGVQGRYFVPLSMFLCLIGRRPGGLTLGAGAVALLVVVLTGDVSGLHAVTVQYPH